MPLAIPTTSNPLPAKLGAYPRARLLQITNFRSDGSSAVKPGVYRKLLKIGAAVLS